MLSSIRRCAFRPPLDLSLYLVTDTAMCARLGVPTTVAAAVAAGVTLVQLRDPAASDVELVALGRDVAAALAGTGVPLIINDRVELVASIGAQGAHVGQDDLDVGEARARLGRSAYLGLSVHAREQVTAAISHGIETLDYLGVGPVWETTSKADAAPPGGLQRLRAITAASPWVSRSAGSPPTGSGSCARAGWPGSPSSARSADSRTSPGRHEPYARCGTTHLISM